MSTSSTSDQTHDPSSLDSTPPPPPLIDAREDFNNNSNNGMMMMKDILLWRKKKQSASVLTTATVTWVLLEIYQFNFITVISWVSMAVVALMFIWGNLLRLIGKEEQKKTGFEISDELATETAMSAKGYGEEGVRWMFRVSAEKEWYVFGGAVGALYLLSILGSCFDFITFLYTGVVMGMTVPVMYVKYENQIKRFGEKIRAQLRRLYNLVDEKLFTKLKYKFGLIEKKEKKVE